MELNHVGLIADGNRRWAKEHQLKYLDAYMITMTRISEFIKFTLGQKIPIISIYLLSKENLLRKRDDLEAVLASEIYLVENLLLPICITYNCKVVYAGNPDLIRKDFREKLNVLCERTSLFDKTILYLLVGYDPVDEINFAIAKDKDFSTENLWVKHRLNCVIRTAGGPMLLSNFLPIQSGYAQIYMIDKFFNDCNEKDFLNVYDKAKSIDMPYGR